MRLDIETIELIKAIKNSVNSTPLNEIEIYRKGEKLEVSEKLIKDFRFTGLSNFLFFEDGFYLETITSEEK